MTAPSSLTDEQVADRFWTKVSVAGPDECWLWQGATNTGGYGRFRVEPSGTRSTAAHRWSLEQSIGQPIPDGMFALHSCDNPPCVNPAHLRVGDHAENMRDRTERKRGWHARQTRCVNGHEFTPENTRINADGSRACRTCHAETQRRRREAQPTYDCELCGQRLSLTHRARHLRTVHRNEAAA